jgi:hypothetical protein
LLFELLGCVLCEFSGLCVEAAGFLDRNWLSACVCLARLFLCVFACWKFFSPMLVAGASIYRDVAWRGMKGKCFDRLFAAGWTILDIIGHNFWTFDINNNNK